MRAQEVANGFDRRGLGAHVERRDVALEIEIALAGGPADEGAEIEHRDERHRLEDADDGEPAAAEPDRLADEAGADAEPRGGAGAEDHGGVLSRSPR